MSEQPARLYLAIALGSAIGALLRCLVSLQALVWLGPAFPWGTLAANVIGSFLIGLCATLTLPQGRFPAGPLVRQFMLTGFCGGFTTFSVFSLELLWLLAGPGAGPALLYLVVSLAGWSLAVWAGFRLGVRFDPPPRLA